MNEASQQSLSYPYFHSYLGKSAFLISFVTRSIKPFYLFSTVSLLFPKKGEVTVKTNMSKLPEINKMPKGR